MNSDREEIIKDIDSLEIAYQIKLCSSEKEDWQQHFHILSLDSHLNNQLFLDYNQLFLNHKPSITLSGLALSQKNPIKKIEVVGKNHCFLAKIGLSSARLGQRFAHIQTSSNSRWKCCINLTHKKKQSFDVVVTLDNNQEITYKKIEFRSVKLSNLSRDKIYNQETNNKLLDKIKSIHISRQLMIDNLSKNKKYLFVIGNARSGTTALARLLNFSPEICLGIERYSLNDDVSALSFERDFFFNPKSEGYLVRPHFYKKINDKFDTVKYVGDKRPRFIKSWKNTFLNLPQAKIIYIFRNIYDVACSYNIRASDAAQGIDRSWSRNRDFSQAVEDWNEGLQEIRNLARFYEVYFVKYEDFFVDKLRINNLFNHLEVNAEEQNTLMGIRQIHNTALSLQKKERNLSDYETEYIDSKADLASYKDILALYQKQF
ncbi:sulfotransferase [Pleurocapsa sp. PCC 7319]|uniref:sulfotransferase family protein n=1 Tax=Pleurocapsa sp. PCC 7319 TaxID=118161 RepID=UPI000349C5E0|nr:sulfotransferase [Pleurocapsa sp. PCC 7319]